MTAGQHWGENWDYSASSGKGPSEWPKHYNAGEQQSPINILIDYRDLQQSRCDNCTNCKSTATNQTSKQQQYQHQISRQFKNLLNLNRSNNNNNNNNSSSRSNYQSNKCNETHLRRDHLDSVGNDLNGSDTDLNRDCLNHSNGGGGGGGGDGNNNLKISNSTTTDNDNDSKLSTATFAWQRVAGAASRRHIDSKQHQKHLAHMQTTRYCATNKKIFLGYPRFLNTLKLTNTGHAWQADLASELASHTLLCGPPLADREYRLAQFHCHWGEDCSSGSEHQVNGQSYSAEIHFVHWNCSQFRSLEEASKHKHGLAVLGVFVQALEGDQHRNKHLDKIIQGVGAIARQAPASTTLANTKLDLKKLFPVNRWDYATYEGSLTTPPLSEVVDWIVFLQPIQCSASQIDQFRRLRCPTGPPLLTNCRPVQELNNRTVSIWTHSNHSHTIKQQQD